MIRIVLFALILMLISGGIYFVAVKKINSNKPAPVTLTLIRESGTVSIKNEGNFEVVSKDETEIPNDTTIKTGEDGLAHIILPDDSMSSLSINTEMTIHYGDTKTNIEQTIGNAWFRVQKLVGRTFEVESPTTLASVRGTIFGVEIGDDDVAYVTEGEVEVAQVSEEQGKKIYKNRQSLLTDKLIHIGHEKDAKITREDLSQTKKDTPWFKRNALFNENFRKLKTLELIRKVRKDTRLKEFDDAFFKARREKLKQKNDQPELLNPATLMQQMGATSLAPQGADACNFYNSAQFDTALAQLEDNRGLAGIYLETVLKSMQKVKSFCVDNTVSESEAKEIQEIFGALPQGKTSLP